MKTRIAYIYILPAFILLGLFAYWPFIAAFRLALYRSDGLQMNDYVGVANFVELAQDRLFHHSFTVLGWFALGLPLQIFGPFIGAKLIHGVRHVRLAYLYRTLLVLPVVVPAMTGILIWRNFYGPDGAVNRFLSLVSLDMLTNTWLGNPSTVIGAIIFMGVPWLGGITMLLYLAGFINIPTELYEAARIDGASSWSVLRKIEMPLLIPYFRIVTILACLGLIQSYENVLVLTSGGPGNATLLPGLYLFQNGFEFGKLGYASAIGFVLFILCLGLTLLNMRVLQKKGY